MVGDLETEEVVDCGERNGVVAFNADLSSVVDHVVLEVDFLFQQLHGGGPGRNHVVDEHWRGIVSRAKGFGDVLKVRTDGIDID